MTSGGMAGRGVDGAGVDGGGRGVGLRISIYFGAAFAIMGVTMPFFNVWLDAAGLSLGEIAAVAIAGSLLRLVSGPVLAFLADRGGSHRALLVGLGWLALVGWIAMSRAAGFWPLLACHLAITVCMSGILPLTETVAMASVRARGLDYGRMRLWGSVTFIAASLVGGWLVEWRGIGAVVWLMLAVAFCAALAGHLLPVSPPSAAPGMRRSVSLADTMALVRRPAVLAFLAAAGAVQGSHAVLYVYGVLHWRGLGISSAWAGALWAIAVIVEIALFAVSAGWVRRWGAHAFLAAGAGAGVVRWAVMAFDPPLAVLVVLQAGHALTYAASHIGAMHVLARAVPEAQAGTAQSLYAMVVSIAMVLATELARHVYPVAGASAYAAMAVMAGIGLAAVAVLWRLEQQAMAARSADDSL